jgi:hypothetical protein
MASTSYFGPSFATGGVEFKPVVSVSNGDSSAVSAFLFDGQSRVAAYSAITHQATPLFGGFFTYTAGTKTLIWSGSSPGSATINVIPGSTLLTLGTLPPGATTTQPVTVSARLVSASGVAVPNVPVQFAAIRSGFSSVTATDLTDSSGFANASLTIPFGGIWTISAMYSPDAGHSALLSSSDSDILSVTQVNQNTVITMNSQAATATVATSISATLRTSSNAVLTPSQILTFTGPFGTRTASTSTVTGTATVTNVVFPAGGTQQVTVTFAGATGYNPSSGTGDVVVSKLPTAFTTMNGPSSSTVGSNVPFDSTLAVTGVVPGPVANATVNYRLTAPDATFSSLSSMTTASGTSSATFAITKRGVHQVQATYLGDGAHIFAPSSTRTLTATQNTALQTAPIVGGVGDTTNASATLTAIPSGEPIAGQVITFTFNSGAIDPVTAITNDQGVATASVVPAVAAGGTFTATFSNPDQFFGSSAATSTFAFTKALTSLTGFALPVPILSGQPFTLSGVLSRTSAPAGPIADAPVTFTVTGASTQTISVMTNATGAVAATITLPVSGNYTISIDYAGSDTLQLSTRTITFPAMTPVTIAMDAIQGTALLPVAVSARVTTQDGPQQGAVVTFVFPLAGPSLSATTNADGVATVQMTFNAAGTFTVNASTPFNPATFLQGASATTSATIAKSATALTPISGPATGTSGTSASFSTTMTRNGVAAANAAVRFVITRPGGSIDVTVGTGTNGTATFNVGSISPANAGNWTVTASVAETVAQTGSSTPPHAFTATIATTLTLSATTETVGSATTFTATLATNFIFAPPANQTIQFSFGGSAVTNSAGVARITYAFAHAGSFPVTASFSKPAAFLNDASASTTAVVNPAPTTLALAAPPSVEAGSPFELSARLTTAGRPVAGAVISFDTATAMTDANGIATAIVVAGCTPQQVSASFYGNGDYLPSSATQTIDVVDSTAPVVTASLGSTVQFTATDNCALVGISAVISFPSTAGFDIVVKKNDKKNTIDIDYKKKQVTVWGVASYAAVLAEGVPVTNGQAVAIDPAKKDVIVLQFTGSTLSSVTGSPTLTVTAVDASGNYSIATAQ